MKVSIIVPVYNVGRYLYQCLRSLEQQTLRDIEIICINDGSTDNSIDIINEFVSRDSRFSVVNKKNTGYGNSMNIGIQQAQGEYIGIVESDDFAEVDMYEKLYAVAEQLQPDIVKGNFNECNKYGICQKVNNLDGVPYNQIISALTHERIFCIHPSIWTAIYKKSFLEENEVRFLETPGASFQDISFSFKALHSASSIVCIPDAVLNYRVENSASSIHNPEKIFCVCDELSEMKRFLEKRYQNNILDDYKYKKAMQSRDWLLYVNYVWNYNRIPMQYKYDFLVQTREEFLNMSKDTFDSKMWTQGDLEIVNCITGSLNMYYSWTSEKMQAQRFNCFKLINNTKEVPQRAFLGFLEDSKRISIFGAGRTGKKVYQFIKDKNLENNVLNFVTSTNEECDFIEDKPVVCISELSDMELKENLFIVSVREKVQWEVLKVLDFYDVKNMILVDEVLEELIQ